MFGKAVGLLSLLLFVFEPNLIANGSLVTTDMATALFLFATVYSFYRYTTKPEVPRLLVTGAMAGLCLVAKHSGVLWAPVLLLLAAAEVALPRGDSGAKQTGRAAHTLRLLGSIVVIGLISITILWAFYGFRYSMRPAGLGMIPDFTSYVGQTGHPAADKVLLTLGRHHVLPEAYLYGFADILMAPRYLTPYLFGKVYPHGLWFYPLATFVIKSTLGFLLLLLTVPICFFLTGVGRWREVLYLTIPALVYVIAALASRFNHGNRYLVPLYPFLIVLVAGAAWRLAASHRAWTYALTVLVVWHVVSSIRAFPDYLPYSNEAWGGPSNTHKFLSDSNVDWGQQLKIAKRYLDTHGIKDCWLDYFARPVADPDYYGIPCKPMPDSMEMALGQPPAIIPARVEGTVLISSDEIAGDFWGPGPLNPYSQFQNLQPVDLIAGGLFVFRGQFDVPLASATAHASAASDLVDQGKLPDALREAQTAVSLAPSDVGSQVALGDVLTLLKRNDEAKLAYQRALTLAETVYPEFQDYWPKAIRKKLAVK